MHPYQQATIATCVLGVVLSGTAVMQRVAETLWERLNRSTRMSSYERRLQRFVANERIDVTTCWSTFLSLVLPFWNHKRVYLVLDLTPYTTDMTTVSVGLLLHSRVLPLAWQLMPQSETWKQPLWDIVDHLFAQVAAHLKAQHCILLADRGLSSLALVQLCCTYHWHYVLHIKQDEQMRRAFRQSYSVWLAGSQIIPKAGMHWYGNILL